MKTKTAIMKIAAIGITWFCCQALVKSADIPQPSPADLANSYQQSTGERTRICLNGFWKISLQEQLADTQPAGDYGIVAVPSAWTEPHEYPIYGLTDYALGSWNGEGKYKGKKMADYPVAWYIRDFKLPAVTAGKRIALKLDRVTMNATIFLNGKEIGRQNEWDIVEWDITDNVDKTGTNTLAVRVDAFLNEEITLHLGTEMTRKVKATASLRGLTQDVWLLITPEAPRFGQTAISTSLRQGKINLDVNILNPGKNADSITVQAAVFEPGKDQPVKQFSSAETKLAPGKNQDIKFGTDWKDAKLWDMKDPHLYRLELTLKQGDKILDKSFPVEFGFREVWIEGKDIVLNGKPIHCINMAMGGHSSLSNLARPVVEREIDLLSSAGYNTIYLRCEGVWRKGHAAQFYDDVLKLADKKGIPVIIPLTPVNDLNMDNPEEKAEWEKTVSEFIARYRNHPSLLFYAMNFNYGGFPWDMIPHSWAEDYQAPDSVLNLGQKRKKMTSSDEFVKKLDPTRIVYHHASSNFGSVMTSNFYCSWPPLQEREDYLSGWSKTGIKPLIFVELGFPMDLDYLRARHGDYNTVRYSEMLEAEYGAPYLGPEVYQKQDDEYLKILDSNATTEQTAMADKYNVNQAYFWRYRLKLHDPIISIQEKIAPEFIRGWRTYGITGFCPWVSSEQYDGRSYEPWHGPQAKYTYDDFTRPGLKPLVSYRPRENDKPSVLLDKYATAFRPVLAYIGGDAKSGFSAKDHAWFAGEKVEKQIVLVNDLRTDLKVEATWQLLDSKGTVKASGTVPMTVKAGSVGFAPISFAAPAVKQREEFAIKLAIPGLPDSQFHIWDLPIQVFPKPSFTYQGRPVLLIDRKGETQKMLEKMGVKATVSQDGKEAKADQLIIIGRGTMDGNFSMDPAVSKAVEAGATLLCFEQPSLENFGLRTHQRGVRRVFPLIKTHPVILGLETADFADWQREQSFLEAYPRPKQGTEDSYPEEGWHWGNKGTICSVMIEKPQYGAFRPILECEFDLAYTPLLESDDGKGRIIFCQLEVTGRYGKVPIPTLLVNQLLNYAGKPASPTLPVVAAGNKELTDYLKDIGVSPQPVSSLSPHTVCVTDGTGLTPETKNKILDFVKNGGTLIVFGQQVLKENWLPVQTEKAEFYRAEPGKAAETIGISTSDLFLKNLRRDLVVKPQDNVTLLAKPGMIAEAKYGTGRILALTIDPRPYLKEKKTPERMRRIYHKLTRVLATLIAAGNGHLKGANSLISSTNTATEISLPEKWRFAIDPKNKGRKNKWMNPEFDDSSWQYLMVPGMWENQGIKDANPEFPDAKRPYNGYAWYRCKVVIPEAMRGQPLALLLGVVDDMDTTYFNGEVIGVTGKDVKDYWAFVRDYKIPENLIKFGRENTIAVKVFDNYLDGGIKGPELKIHVVKTETFPYMDAKPPFNPYKLKRW